MVIKIKSNELNKDLIYHFNKSNELKDFSNIIDRRSIKQIDSIIDDFNISYNDDKKIPSNLQELILKISCKLFKKNKLTYNYDDKHLNLSNSNNYDIIQNYIEILNKNFKSKDPKRSTSDESVRTEASEKHVDKEETTIAELVEKSKELVEKSKSLNKTSNHSSASKSDESIKKVKAGYIKEFGSSEIEPEIKIDGDNNTKIELLPTILNFPKILESKIDKIIKEKISKKLKEINDEKKKDEIADLVNQSNEYNSKMYPILITLTKKQHDEPILITLTKKQKQHDEPILITLTKKQKQDNEPILITLTKKQDDEPILIALRDKINEKE